MLVLGRHAATEVALQKSKRVDYRRDELPHMGLHYRTHDMKVSPICNIDAQQ
jgi:hypothetical protein